MRPLSNHRHPSGAPSLLAQAQPLSALPTVASQQAVKQRLQLLPSLMPSSSRHLQLHQLLLSSSLRALLAALVHIANPSHNKTAGNQLMVNPLTKMMKITVPTHQQVMPIMFHRLITQVPKTTQTRSTILRLPTRSAPTSS